MKANWHIKKLGAVCEIDLGKTPSRANTKYWDKFKQTHNVWLSIADLLNAEDNVISDSKEYISNSGAEMSKIVKKGTLLVSFKLTLGRLAFAGKDLYTNEAIAALTINNEKELSKEYLYHYLTFFDWHAAVKGDVKIKGKTLNKSKLKEIDVLFPPLLEQKRIVKKLDEVFENAAMAKGAAEKNLQNAKELFESYLQSVFANPGKDWGEKTLREVSAELLAGGDVPKGNFSKTRTERYPIPIFANGVKDKGLYGYTSIRKIVKPCVTVSARGTIGYAEIRRESFFPIVRLIVLIPNEKLINLEFLYYVVCNLNFANTGTSIPQLTIPMIENIKIAVPSLEQQKSIVEKLTMLSIEVKKLERTYEQKLASVEELKKSVLASAFAGKL